MFWGLRTAHLFFLVTPLQWCWFATGTVVVLFGRHLLLAFVLVISFGSLFQFKVVKAHSWLSKFLKDQTSIWTPDLGCMSWKPSPPSFLVVLLPVGDEGILENCSLQCVAMKPVEWHFFVFVLIIYFF